MELYPFIARIVCAGHLGFQNGFSKKAFHKRQENSTQKTKRSDPSPQQRQRSIKEYFSPEKKEDGGDLKNNLSSDVVRTSLSPNPREASANSSVNSSSISTPLSSQSGSDQAATSSLSTNGSCNTSYRRRKRARLSKENR